MQEYICCEYIYLYVLYNTIHIYTNIHIPMDMIKLPGVRFTGPAKSEGLSVKVNNV